MKTSTLVLAFLPLIAFSLLARFLPSHAIGLAALVAALLALIAIAISRPVWPPKVLNVCSLVLFAVLAVLGFSLGRHDDSWLARWGGAGVGIILGLVILALVPVLPFTEQFARESVPRAAWGSATFKRINLVLSTAWGLAILALGASRTVAVALDRHSSHHLLEVVFSLALPVVLIVYMLNFSKAYPDRVTGADTTDTSG
ncbi:hypothetical protein OG455_02795 [Kitasatospora sp. NBC_01287]|uniref:hypothetical protein n=1 Tax=Kitasatospora sp. NBC_01287 TaxID=2903573 RepID=UPI00224DC55C|nr:hypothetical protein [Kitasatospora sp. NBC_01287]MCX4744455.1 hypothetical protein [Kitasatospora sp. NBC_01287]